MIRPAHDALSLTLPSRSKSRVRARRPRKPTLREIVCLIYTVATIVWAVHHLLGGELISGVYFAGCAGAWWRGFQRARAGHLFGLSRLGLAWIVGGGFLVGALEVLG